MIARVQSVSNRILPKGRFARGVSQLSLGTVLGQIVILLVMPVLTRLYSPADFGILGVYATVLGIITVVCSLRYEMAIPLPTRDHAAFQVVGISFLCLIATTFILVVLGAGPGQYVLAKFGAGEVNGYYWLIPVGVFLSGLYQISSCWAVRRKAYGVIALTRILQGLSSSLTQIGLGVMQFGPLGLLIGQIVGQASGLYRLGRSAVSDYKGGGATITWRGMRWAASRYSKFARFDTWAALLNTASASLPIFLFATLFGPKLVGYYMVSVRLLSAPITLFGKSVSQVLLPHATEARRENTLGQIVFTLMRVLALVAFTPFFVFAIVSPALFGHVFGSDWMPAGKIASYTSLWVTWQFVYSPLSTVLLAVEAQRTNLFIQTMSFTLRGLSIYIAYLFADEFIAVLLFSMTSIAVYAVALLIVMHCSGASVRSSFLGIAAEVLISGLTVMPLLLVSKQALWLVLVFMLTALAIWGGRLRRNLGALKLNLAGSQ